MIPQCHHLKYPWSRTVCVQAPRIGNKNDCRQCAALIDFNRTPRKRLKIGKENEGVSDSSELGQSTQGRKTCRDTHFAIISIFIALPIICMSGLMTASYRPIHAQHSIFCQKKRPVHKLSLGAGRSNLTSQLAGAMFRDRRLLAWV